MRIKETIEGIFGSEDTTDDSGRVDIDDIDGEEMKEVMDYLNAIGEEATRENIEKTAHHLRRVDEDEQLVSAYSTGEERGRIDKSIVAPSSVNREKKWHTRDGDFYQILTATSLPSRVTPGWLIPLTLSEYDVRISTHIKPRETDTTKGKLQQRLTQSKSAIQWKNKRGRTDVYEEEHERSELERLLRGVIEGTTKLYDVAFYVEVRAETSDDLDEASRNIQRKASEQDVDLIPVEGRQLDSTKAVAPTGVDPINNNNTVQIRALSTFFNFVEPPVSMPEGVLVGFDESKRPVIVDRFGLSGHCKAVTGKIGGGKTYGSKMAIYRRLLNDTGLRSIIFDPLGDDFIDFTNKLGGQVIEFGGGDRINPLEIKPAEAKTAQDPYKTKIRSVVEILKTYFNQSSRQGMTAGQEGVIIQCINYAYSKMGITSDPETFDNESPILSDAIEGVRIVSHGGLKKVEGNDDIPIDVSEDDLTDCSDRTKDVITNPSEKHIEIARDLVPMFEAFEEGGINSNLNGQTNIDLDDRIVCFNMEAFADTNEMPLIMHTMLEWAYQEARQSPKRVDVTFEEAHYLLGQEGSRNLLNLFIRHSRHFDAGLTLITQTPDEFLNSEAKKEIYDNCDIKQLFYQENVSQEVIDYFDFSEEEVRFLRRAAKGKKSNFSECLYSTSEHGRRRLEIYSGTYEHHIIEDGLDPWGFAKQEGITSTTPNEVEGRLDDEATELEANAQGGNPQPRQKSGTQSYDQVEPESVDGPEDLSRKPDLDEDTGDESANKAVEDPYSVEGGAASTKGSEGSHEVPHEGGDQTPPRNEQELPEEQSTARGEPQQGELHNKTELSEPSETPSDSPTKKAETRPSETATGRPTPDKDVPEPQADTVAGAKEDNEASPIEKVINLVIGDSSSTDDDNGDASNNREPRSEESSTKPFLERHLGKETAEWLMKTLPVALLVLVVSALVIFFIF